MNHRRHRGAAAVESLIIISFFALTWTGVNYMAKVGAVTLKTRSQARTCAFYVATHSCDETPPECQATTRSETNETASDANSELTAKASEDEDSEYTEGTKNELNETLDLGLFKRVDAKIGASVEAPEMFGGETTDLSQSFTLPCTPKPGTLGDKIKELFNSAFGNARKDQE